MSTSDHPDRRDRVQSISDLFVTVCFEPLPSKLTGRDDCPAELFVDTDYDVISFESAGPRESSGELMLQECFCFTICRCNCCVSFHGLLRWAPFEPPHPIRGLQTVSGVETTRQSVAERAIRRRDRPCADLEVDTAKILAATVWLALFEIGTGTRLFFDVDVVDGRLERIHKDDGQRYFRLPESEDPLERGGDVALSHADLLPIQQLAKMDEDMLRATTSSLPSRLAAKFWKARVDSTVGDNPWRKGSAGVREHVSAGDMKHWIRRQETGVSDSYAKKLVSRTIGALLELSKSRLAVKKRRQRKNGLEYTERRVLLMDDADIPGESLEARDT